MRKISIFVASFLLATGGVLVSGAGGTTAPDKGGAFLLGPAGTTPYCRAIESFAFAEPPAKVTVPIFHSFAKKHLSSYEKLASEAPNSVKKTLGQIVTILKYEKKVSSQKALEKYAAATNAVWPEATLKLTESLATCFGAK